MSSRTSLVVALLAGCNQLFGSQHVELAPSAQFDAPLDAPFACPAIGETPQFSPYVHQFLARDCAYYGTAGNVAIAECAVGPNLVVQEGPIDGELQPAMGIPPSTTPGTPRLAPDGQTLLVRTAAAVVEYTRAGDGWVVSNPAVFALTGSTVPYSSIAQAGNALRVLYVDFPNAGLVELERTGTTWMQRSAIPLAALGLGSTIPDGLSLSSDGLRLVVATALETRYTDRANLDTTFRSSDQLQAPSAPDVYASADCARIYMSGLGSVFYAQRL